MTGTGNAKRIWKVDGDGLVFFGPSARIIFAAGEENWDPAVVMWIR